MPDLVRQVASAVLYEGYLLWPYRRSALKNQHRWTIGGVYPPPSGRAYDGGPHLTQTQCLLVADPEDAVSVSVRFLHVVSRGVARLRDGRLEAVPELIVGTERHLAWEEATEREVAAGPMTLAELGRERTVPISVDDGQHTEWLSEPDGRRVGAVVRKWRALRGRVELAARRLTPDVQRLTVRVHNLTAWHGQERPEALRRTFVSAHVVVHADRAHLVSMTDPPAELAALAGQCENIQTWPVLVGAEGERHTMLSAPIILPDYPQIAPESPGDLFDATEIDQLLTLSILSLSDDERREMRDSDPRARDILDRCAALSPSQLLGLHGRLREVRPVPVPREDGAR